MDRTACIIATGVRDGKELVELSPKTGLRKKKVDPVKLASRLPSPSRVAQRFSRLSGHP